MSTFWFNSYTVRQGSFTCPLPIERRAITGPHGGLSGGILIGHCGTIWVGVEQEEWLEVTPDTFRCHIFPLGANLDTRYYTQKYVCEQEFKYLRAYDDLLSAKFLEGASATIVKCKVETRDS